MLQLKQIAFLNIVLFALANIFSVNMLCPGEEPSPHPNRGLYAIWYGKKEKPFELPYIVGGQIFLQWRDLEKAQGEYDFAKLDEKLAEHARHKRPATLQVNGNRRPDYLFEICPYLPEKVSPQVSDSQGSLMYWHPAHREAYLDFIEALGNHLKSSPHREMVVGVRLNFNAFGTEHLHLKREYRPLDRWVVPEGVDPGSPWTRQEMECYKQAVIEAFIEHFLPEIYVFVRNNVVLDDQIDPVLLESFETGRLGLFHTSSEVQPRGQWTEKRYQAFLRYGKPGKTYVYAESWADALGNHGGTQDDRPFSPVQWNYWRLLVDLHCGVSLIAIYNSDLKQVYAPKDEITKKAFDEAFRFAAKYAGYHASPKKAPGTWIAFRGGEYLPGDYTYLMHRLEEDASEPVRRIGPETQPYGPWARRLPSDAKMRLSVHPAFLESLKKSENPALLRLVILAKEQAAFSVKTASQTYTLSCPGDEIWHERIVEVDPHQLVQDSSGTVLTLESKEHPLFIHMVELQRTTHPRKD